MKNTICRIALMGFLIMSVAGCGSAVGDGFGHATALLVTGISAPAGEFSHVKDQLLEVVRSWKLDDGYVQDGLAALKQNGERLQAISKTLSETSDIITTGWNERSKADDVRIQKESDRILGIERLYNPDTGDVYEVENGFYDYYQTHERDFSVKNLEPIPDNAYELWDKAPRINNGFISP